MNKIVSGLNHDQKIALARLVSDIIIADNIIDEKEISKFEEYFGDEKDKEIFFEAQKLSLEKAIENFLSIGNIAQKAYARDILTKISMSDGICDSNEAYILMALKFMLDKKNKENEEFSIKSIKRTNQFVFGNFVVYAEPSLNKSKEKKLTSRDEDKIKEIRNNINRHYTIISYLLDSIGFQFLFVPREVAKYTKNGKDNFKRLVKYVFPTVEEKEVETVYNKISKLDVSKFSDEYLLDIHCEGNCPELFIMIGQSEVINPIMKNHKTDKYLNFIKLKLLDSDVRSKIEQIVCEYNKIVSYNNYFTFNPTHEKIEYQGVFKLFFNLIAYPIPIPGKWTLYFHTHRARKTMSINNDETKLNASEAALYLAIFFTSFYGDTRGFPKNSNNLTEAQKNYYKDIYTYCYRKIRGISEVTQNTVFERVIKTCYDINKNLRTYEDLNIKKDNDIYIIKVEATIRIDDEIFEETDLYKKLSTL